MNLAIISFFRNSESSGHVQRFMKQVAALKDAWPEHLRLIAVYGDCVDETANALQKLAAAYHVPLQLIEFNHGGPSFGSVVSEERFSALSQLGNIGLGAIGEQDDLVFYVESDLIWTPEAVFKMAVYAADGADVVAPLVFAGEDFYDVYCFRKDGEQFAPFFPYHSKLNHNGGGLTEVDSVGSAFVMKGSVARKARIRNNDVLLGFCADARAQGFRIFVDAKNRVEHPL